MVTRSVWLAAVLAAGCGDEVVTMTLRLPSDADRWDTSCVQTIEVFTEGANYPEQSDDYLGQTLDVSDSPPKTYAEVQTRVRGKFDVKIPATGLSGVEMYGWNGPSGFFSESTLPDLVFFARTGYIGQDPIVISLVPNLDCKLSTVVVRPIDLIALVTSKSCTTAALTQPDAYVSLGTLSPGLYKDYLFGWGGQHGASVVGGVATIMASTTVGPRSCLALYTSTMTAYSGGCATPQRACATGSEIEAVLVDPVYAQNSLDANIQDAYRGAIVGAVLDAQKNGIAGATIEIDATRGQLVYVDLDTAGKRLVPVTGTATTASGMFILYTNDLLETKVTVGATSKSVILGAQRNFNDGTKAPAGVAITF